MRMKYLDKWQTVILFLYLSTFFLFPSGGCTPKNKPSATYTISGTITSAATGSTLSNVAVFLTGGSPGQIVGRIVAISDATGAYSFNGLSNGTYAVSPVLSGCTFTPLSQTASVSGSNASNLNFIGTVVYPVTTLAAGLASPGSVAVDATDVYWTDFANGGAVINKIGINGGNLTTIASGLVVSNGIIVDPTSIYWSEDAGGTIKKVGINGGAITTLSTGTYPGTLAVDSANVYWSDYNTRSSLSNSGTINKVGIDGGTVTTIATGSYPGNLAIDSTNVYWIDFDKTAGFNSGGSIDKVGINGGPVTTLATGTNLGSIAVDSTSVYWTEQGDVRSISPTGTIKKVSINGGIVTTIATGGVIGSIAVDSTNVYWTESSTIKKVGINGGTITTLVNTGGEDYFIMGFAIDSTSVYWTQASYCWEPCQAGPGLLCVDSQGSCGGALSKVPK